MKVLIEIDEKTFKDFHETVVINIGRSGGKNIIEKCLKAISKGTPIPDNATNGDVIKVVFPNTESRLDENTGIMLVKWVDGTVKTFKENWWNAPYRAESEK